MTTPLRRGRKGAAACAWARIKLEWEEPERLAGNVFTGFLAVVFINVAYSHFPLLRVLGFLFCCWQMGFWVTHSMLADKRLRIARDGMLFAAFQECHCGEEGHCIVCKVRDALEKQFPGDIEYELRSKLRTDSPAPEELVAAYLTPDEVAREREQGRMFSERWKEAMRGEPE